MLDVGLGRRLSRVEVQDDPEVAKIREAPAEVLCRTQLLLEQVTQRNVLSGRN